MSPDPTAQRRKGLAVMSQVYGWTVEDGPGEFWAHTADHPFADVWSREGLSMRDRRLLLTGALSATGQIDIAEIQAGAALRNADWTAMSLLSPPCSPVTTSAGQSAPS
jgi:4-carboxymuconolactone decarboxylase